MNQQANTKIIAIMGPTATGKTALALQLAQQLTADIISVDSALIYRDMDIGTAKPSSAELEKAPHRLINIVDPVDSYSAGQFCMDATREIQAIRAHHHIPLLVGGTMLYFHKLFFGLSDLPTADKTIRDQLTKEAEKIGWAAMHEKLRAVDPDTAAKIKDPQRIQRALEVYALTGKPLSQLHKNKTQYFSKDEVEFIILMPQDRQWLHQRIRERFEKMLAEGFIDEVRMLKNRGDLHLNLPSMRVVGYRQVWEYLDGQYNIDTMKEKAMAATRQLAKRQMTWLRKWEGGRVFDPKELKITVLLDSVM